MRHALLLLRGCLVWSQPRTGVQPSRALVDDAGSYDAAVKATLNSLADAFTELEDRMPESKEFDVSLSNDVLTVNMGKHHGTYVINRQTPNKQIWVSSPFSGPMRFDYSNGEWVSTRSGKSLKEVLEIEVSGRLHQDIKLKY